jgi:hypothetical protein
LAKNTDPGRVGTFPVQRPFRVRAVHFDGPKREWSAADYIPRLQAQNCALVSYAGRAWTPLLDDYGALHVGMELAEILDGASRIEGLRE